MKKFMAILGIIVVFGIIGSFMEDEETAKPAKEEPKQEEVKEKEPVKAEKPAPAPKPKKEEPKVETAYTENMSNSMKSLSNSLGLMTDVSMELADNPYLASTESWIMDAAVAITSLESDIENIRSISKPKDPQLLEAHLIILKAMDHYEFVVENWPNAIDNMDVELMGQCTENLSIATEYIKQANDIIVDYNGTL